MIPKWLRITSYATLPPKFGCATYTLRFSQDSQSLHPRDLITVPWTLQGLGLVALTDCVAGHLVLAHYKKSVKETLSGMWCYLKGTYFTCLRWSHFLSSLCFSIQFVCLFFNLFLCPLSTWAGILTIFKKECFSWYFLLCSKTVLMSVLPAGSFSPPVICQDLCRWTIIYLF